MQTVRPVSFAMVLDRLAQESLARDVSFEVVTAARHATIKRLGVSMSSPLGLAQQRRAQAYFAAVVARRALRRGQPARGAARIVVAAVVQDLRAAGRDGELIWDHLQRGWSDQVPADVLEEYRLELCG
jgi:hypothetical protein